MPGPGYAYFGSEEEKNLLEVVQQWREAGDTFGALTVESQIGRFETEAAARFAAPYCVAVNSGTSALLTALAALGIGPGDEVIVPGYMFVASLATIVYSGATPVLAEIDESFTLDVSDVRRRLTPRTRAIMAVHMLGAPSDMDALTALAREHGVAIVEDVAQACGATYRGRPLGTWGDVGAFSLNPFKVITAGEGGFVLTADPRLHQRAFSFHDHGFLPGGLETGEGDLLFGLNLHMTDFAAAVARAQLGKMAAILRRTRQVKQSFVAQVPPRPGVRRRTFHDAGGECGTLAVYIFGSAEAARAVAGELGITVLAESPKHNYARIPALPALTAAGRPSAPFHPGLTAAAAGGYRPGCLPRTDDLLGRSIAIAIGLSDSYLGAGFGVTVRSTAAEVARKADRFRAVLDRVLS
ncbi:DegT/DnrJ/EryC1/StrS family aminotransferase [Nonomuraea typhae]|uniref:DegT/DnrJ/EryC1/StrS family aminotransferase n=1 Tax=Nonomuraea typhae TaxID=2603600 RepID=UPI0012FB3B92|nr:aminotransferase class I/II-fold pyridoxal phosphate-dependent enzyme [Nonomuraea typhae]